MKEQPKIVEVNKYRREVILRWLKKGVINVDELRVLPEKRVTDNMTEEEQEAELHRLCTLFVDSKICQRLMIKGKCLKYSPSIHPDKETPREAN